MDAYEEEVCLVGVVRDERRREERAVEGELREELVEGGAVTVRVTVRDPWVGWGVTWLSWFHGSKNGREEWAASSSVCSASMKR